MLYLLIFRKYLIKIINDTGCLHYLEIFLYYEMKNKTYLFVF